MTERTEFPSIRLEIGGRIREAERHFNARKDAAAAAGVSKSTFDRWVNGPTDISIEDLARFALKSGFSLEWLALGLEPKLRDVPASSGSATAHVQMIDADVWEDIFNIVSDIAAMNAQPLALARHHQVVHDIYNRAARFATVSERNAAITVLVVDRVAAAHQAQSAHESLEARRRKPPEAPPDAASSDPEEPV